MTAVTNALFDALIASESAPIVRVTNIDSYFPPANTGMVPVECTTTLTGASLWISYDELAVDAIWAERVKTANGRTAVLDAMYTILDAQATAIAAMSDPHTWTNWASVINALRAAGMNPIKGV